MALERALDTVAAEAADKVASMIAASRRSEQRLAQTAALRLGRDGAADVARAVAFARSLPFESPSYPSLEAYLAHPLRIATIVLRLDREPSAMAATVAVLHNVYEVSGLAEEDLERAGFGPDVAHAVRLLTVDRSREDDSAYMTCYYSTIRASGPRLALVRCVDKLDNILGLELFPDGAIRDSYLDGAELHVVPLARELDPWFGDFFQEVVDYMRATGCRPDLKARYDALVARDHQ